MSLRGHMWTVAPLARWQLRPDPLGRFEPWSEAIEDPRMGSVRLSGALHRGEAPSRTLLIAIHGLGGDIDSHYIHRAARAARAAGLDCLRLNLRGADRSGCDFYHAGLLDDLRAAAASPAVASYRRLLVLGYSLGGHLALRYAQAPQADPRLAAVAAVCPPLDLAAAVRDMDAGWRWPYRRYVLGALKDMIKPMAARGRLPAASLREALAIRRLRSWDERLVVPRFGFRDVDSYYRHASAAPHLDRLRVPALLVVAREDPMVLARSIEAALPRRSSPALSVRWLGRAGHVGFAPDVSLGEDAPRGLESQALAWLVARCTT